MKKQGFTLVEIIVVITLIAFIGTVSFFGIRLVTKNIKVSKLEQITDNVLRAAEIYIETNKDTKTQLYNNKNSVIIPLNTLVNEGLLDLKGTTLEDKDIENEYVVTAFTKTSSKENCIDITTSTSWNLSKDNPFYICSNDSGSSNSIIIGGTSSNIDTVKVQDEVAESDGIYTYTSFIENSTENYIKYKGNTYNIYYVDRDDSLVLYSKTSFGDIFKDRTQNISQYKNNVPPTYCKYGASTDCQGYCNDCLDKGMVFGSLDYGGDYYFYSDSSCKGTLYSTTANEYIYIKRVGGVYSNIIIETSPMYYLNVYKMNDDFGIKNGEVSASIDDSLPMATETKIIYLRQYYYDCNKTTLTYYTPQFKKIKLKSCMKITGGTGNVVNPYELSDLC